MTVAYPANKIVYGGNGVTTVFSFPFDLPTNSDGSDVFAYVVNASAIVTPLTGNYSVNPATKELTYPLVAGVSPLDAGVAVLPVGWKLVIARIEDIVQGLSLIEQGSFSSRTIMAQLDYMTMIAQQQQEQLDRCFKYPIDTQAPDNDTVQAFLAAIAAVLPNFSYDSYVNLKNHAAINPTLACWGWATDQKALVFYTGDTTVGDNGWFILGS